MKSALAALLVIAAPAAPHDFGAPLADADLATMRGGIRLADGTDVAIGVAIETQVNGIVALRTQFSTVQPGVQVYAGGTPNVSAAAAGTATGAPIIAYSRNAAGTLVTVSPGTAVSAVNVGAGALPPPTGPQLAVQPNGAAVATALGPVALRQTAGGFTTELMGNGFDVQQLIGQATGSVVQNTVNNQVITTATWVSINLTGVQVPSNLASTLGNAARSVQVH